MRTWGRITNPDGSRTWTEVSTDANGFNDYVYVTTLIQTLLLNLAESPFYADRGIPAQQSVQTQIPPDFYIAYTQQIFAPYFANLVVAKIKAVDTDGVPYPAYAVNALTHTGVVFEALIPS